MQCNIILIYYTATPKCQFTPLPTRRQDYRLYSHYVTSLCVHSKKEATFDSSVLLVITVICMIHFLFMK